MYVGSEGEPMGPSPLEAWVVAGGVPE